MAHARALKASLIYVAVVASGLGTLGHAATAGLERGYASKEELVKRFVDALGKKDEPGLSAMRVTQKEYVDIILPGAVAEGQPLRQWPQDVREYFFREFNQKSSMAEQELLLSYGGHEYVIESMEFEGGVKRYANHVAHRQLRLRLKDESGNERSLATGSIVEIDGRYKFMSYLAD